MTDRPNKGHYLNHKDWCEAMAKHYQEAAERFPDDSNSARHLLEMADQFEKDSRA